MQSLARDAIEANDPDFGPWSEPCPYTAEDLRWAAAAFAGDSDSDWPEDEVDEARAAELEAEERLTRGLLSPDFAEAMMATSIVGHREEY